MNILVTGANGFVGKNLCRALENIKENKDRTHPGLQIDEIYKYDLSTPAEKLRNFAKRPTLSLILQGLTDRKTTMNLCGAISALQAPCLKLLKNTAIRRRL